MSPNFALQTDRLTSTAELSVIRRPEQNTMLQNLLRVDLDLVICGSAAGQRSALLGHYYAGRGNKFWRTLATTGLTSRQLQPAESRLLLDFGIGLTDLVKSQAGNDDAIRFAKADRNRLSAAILSYQPRYLCFNGKRAAREFFQADRVEYGLQTEVIGATAIFVAPSTSAAANAAWDLSVWQDLANRIRAAKAAA